MINRRLVATSGLIAPILAASGADAHPAEDTQANKALVRRFFEEVWSTGDIGRRDDFLAAEYRGHIAGAEAPIDRDGWTAWFQGFRAAFPDARFTVEDLLPKATGSPLA